MSVIISTEIKVYAGTTTSGSQIGSTITDSTSGGPSSVNLNSTSLGVALSAGEQYCVIARCTNDESYTTDWTQPYPFKTLIFTEILSASVRQNIITPVLDFTYNSNVLSVSDCGVYISTNASGSNATKQATDEQDAGQGWDLTGLSENTRYYLIPYVIDDLGREYKGDWADAESCLTGYAVPTVVISNVATTYNSITGNVNITTNDTLSGVTATITPTGGGATQTVALTATTGLQTLSLVGGTTPLVGGGTLSLTPSIEYRITVTATNTSGGSGNATVTATTAAQSTATIAITSITGITPFAATVNLSYGGGTVVNPTPGE